MSDEPRKESSKIHQAFARWAPGCAGYELGTICTPHGMVDVMIQGDDRHHPLTRLDMVVDGRLHIWTYERRYSTKHAVTLANRMAEHLTS